MFKGYIPTWVLDVNRKGSIDKLLAEIDITGKDHFLIYVYMCIVCTFYKVSKLFK